MWHGADGMGWWLVFAGFAWLLLWVSLAAVAASVLGRSPWRRDLHDADALEIVRRRYARGEIDREEFERLREDLYLKEDQR